MQAGDDRRLMADSLARWLDGREDTPASQLREELGAAGWLWPWPDDLLLPRAQHVALVGEAIGRAAAPVAYPSLVLAASLLERLPVEDGAVLMEALAAGKAPVAVALQQASGAALAIDAAGAGRLLVASPSDPWIGAMPRTKARLRPVRTLDGHAAAFVDPVAPGQATVVASGDEALRVLDAATDWAVLASCAVVSGLLQRLVAQTVAHVKVRRQFGVAIGSFQAVQHRAVDMHVATEELRALLHATTAEMDDAGPSLAVDRLRTKCGRSARFVVQGAVQLHGAMALTEELPVGRAVRCVEAELARHRSPGAAAARLQDALLAA